MIDVSIRCREERYAGVRVIGHEAVSAQLLPARRSFWGERCAWMAATLKENAEDGDSTWSDFALVARDLLDKRPLDSIPLATRIASATVEAFEQR